MKKWLLHIIYISVLGMLAASCSNYFDEGIPSAATDKISVTFTLAMNVSGSRAVIEDDEVGNSYENRIDKDGLQVLFYDADMNTCMGKVENIVLFRTVSENVYQFMGNLEVKDAVDYTLASCKVMVFANSEEVTTNAVPTSLTFDYNTDGFRNESVNIPMWGVASFTDLRLAPGTNTDLGTIYLLRAMAKVEVLLSAEAAAEFNLTGVSLNKYNEKGYYLPNTNAGIERTDAEWQNRVGDAGLFNVCVSPKEEALAFKSVGENNYILYIPEYNNADDLAFMTVNLTDKGSNSVLLTAPRLYFKNYETGENFDVVRNRYYRYIINKVNVNTEVNLELQYQVVDWTTVDNGNLNFGNSSGDVGN